MTREEDIHKGLVENRSSGKGKRVNMCYLSGLLATICIGTIQFGYSIGAWNTVTDAYFFKYPTTKDDQTNKQSQI